ncbi:MAG: cell wall hydrolase [Lachnospiraceae bacterium]|nr:cell wall hydrolase [Lachnospiraceae bacterium]
MKTKRGLVAFAGLVILFGCAWCGFYSANEWEDGMEKITVSAKGSSAQTEDLQENVEIVAQQGCYGKHENARQEGQTQIEPKVNVYRNASRGIALSQEDYNVLLRIVEAEATGGTRKSKKMVANVVLNRVVDSHFPNTVSEVVYQRCSDGTPQFSPISDGRFFSVTVTDSTKKAVDQVLKGKDETDGALFFVNRNSASSRALAWFDSKLDYLFECGGHSFYCYKD